MQLLTGKRKRALINEGIMRGLMAARTRVRYLDISKRDLEVIEAWLALEIDKLQEIINRNA